MLLFMNIVALALLVLCLFYEGYVLATVKWLLDTIRTLVLGALFGIAGFTLAVLDIVLVVVTVFLALVLLFLSALVGLVFWGVTRRKAPYNKSVQRSETTVQFITDLSETLEQWIQSGLAHTGKGFTWLKPSVQGFAAPFVWVFHKLWPSGNATTN